MIISGILWFVIILAVFALFFAIGKMKKPVKSTKSFAKDATQFAKDTTRSVSKSVKSSTQNALQGLHKQLVKNLPDYNVNMKKNHITIIKASKKLMMITLDKGVAVGTRKMGGVVVMNFHSSPSYKQVLSELKG